MFIQIKKALSNSLVFILSSIYPSMNQKYTNNIINYQSVGTS